MKAVGSSMHKTGEVELFLTHDYKEDKNPEMQAKLNRKSNLKEPKRKTGEMAHKDTDREEQKLKESLCQGVRKARGSAST